MAPGRQAPGNISAAPSNSPVCPAPWRTEHRLRSKQLDGALKLGDEGKSKLGAGSLPIEAGAFNQFLLRLGGNRNLH